MVDRYQAGGARHPARHPAALRRRLRARPRQPPGARPSSRTTSGSARPATPSSSSEIGHITARRPGRPAAVGVRAVRLRRPRRPLGPHLRELRREPGARRRPWRRRSTDCRAAPGSSTRRTGCWPPPSTSRATGSRTFGTGEGDYTIDQGIDEVVAPEFERLALAPYLPAVRRAPRRLGHAVLLQRRLDRGRPREPGQDARQQRAHHRRAQGRLGFDGFVISDWRAIRQLPGDYADQVEASVNAGVDMFMEPIQARTTRRVARGSSRPSPSSSSPARSPRSRIDDAVSRILTAKFELGLFEHPMTDRSNIDASAAQPTTRSRGGPPPRARCCCGTTERTLPLKPRPGRVRRRQQRRQHRQPGGRLDAHLAGRLHQRHPGRRRSSTGIEEPARGDVTFSEDAADAGAAPAPPVSWWSARRRTPRGSATSAARSGPTTRATTTCRDPRRTWCSPTPTPAPFGRSARRRRRARCSSSPGARW